MPAGGATASVATIFVAFLRLGLTSFGGPIAHIGYLQGEFVKRRNWLGDDAFAQLLAMCQSLPGPASSQLVFALGYLQRGWVGAVAASLAFTLPSAIVMVLLGLGSYSAVLAGNGALHAGLGLVTVSVVAHALLTMRRTLCPDWQRMGLALLAAAVVLLVAHPLVQLAILAGGASVGYGWLAAASTPAAAAVSKAPPSVAPTRQTSMLLLAIGLLLLVGLPLAARVAASPYATATAGAYQAGALVFGGGHVVLPLLEARFVDSGLVTHAQFLTGYGAAQAMPGPLFTFAGFLGASSLGIVGAVLVVVAIFTPGYLLVTSGLTWWQRATAAPAMQGALRGINAVVVGLLLATWMNPVVHKAILSPSDVGIAAGGGLALLRGTKPIWVVLLIVAAAAARSQFG